MSNIVWGAHYKVCSILGSSLNMKFVVFWGLYQDLP